MNLVNSASIFMPYKKFVALAVLIGPLCLVSACSSDSSDGNVMTPEVDPNTEVPDPISDSIADTLRENMDYGTLLNLIEDADLAEALQDDNAGLGWTLFAPSDESFNDVLESLSSEQTKSLVRNHLYSGRIASNELVPGTLVMTEGTVAVVANGDGTVTVGGARIVARDRIFSNGIIHFVDAVLQSQ